MSVVWAGGFARVATGLARVFLAWLNLVGGVVRAWIALGLRLPRARPARRMPVCVPVAVDWPDRRVVRLACRLLIAALGGGFAALFAGCESGLAGSRRGIPLVLGIEEALLLESLGELAKLRIVGRGLLVLLAGRRLIVGVAGPAVLLAGLSRRSPVPDPA